MTSSWLAPRIPVDGGNNINHDTGIALTIPILHIYGSSQPDGTHIYRYHNWVIYDKLTRKSPKRAFAPVMYSLLVYRNWLHIKYSITKYISHAITRRIYNIVLLDAFAKYITAYRYIFLILEQNDFLHDELMRSRNMVQSVVLNVAPTSNKAIIESVVYHKKEHLWSLIHSWFYSVRLYRYKWSYDFF